MSCGWDAFEGANRKWCEFCSYIAGNNNRRQVSATYLVTKSDMIFRALRFLAASRLRTSNGSVKKCMFLRKDAIVHRVLLNV